jgi:hypothetical protein
MTTAAKRWLFWTPRILCILFAAFLGLFALDVFEEGRGFWQTALALFMHLLPSTILAIVVLILSWRREWIGGMLFTALGVLHIVLFWGRFAWYVYAAFSGPLLVIGILFLLNWRYRAELRPR